MWVASRKSGLRQPIQMMSTASPSVGRRGCEFVCRPPALVVTSTNASPLCSRSCENLINLSEVSPRTPLSANRSPRTPLSTVRSPLDAHVAAVRCPMETHAAGPTDDIASEVGSSSMDSAATCEDPRLVVALLRLMTNQARGLNAVRENTELASAQLIELRASLAEVKCCLVSNELGWPWCETEAILQALAATETQLDRALCSEVVACSPPRPRSGRRAVGPESPSPRCRSSRATFPGAEPAAAGEIRMRLFRISHSLDRLERAVQTRS